MPIRNDAQPGRPNNLSCRISPYAASTVKFVEQPGKHLESYASLRGQLIRADRLRT
jgi:hypothetical protein